MAPIAAVQLLETCVTAKSTSAVTPFYKGESQEKTVLLRLEEAGMFAFSPAPVMLPTLDPQEPAKRLV